MSIEDWPELAGLTAEEMREAAQRLGDAAAFADIIGPDATGPTVLDVEVSPRVAAAILALRDRLRAEAKSAPTEAGRSEGSTDGTA